MKEFIPWLIFLIVAAGASALRWWFERKQRAEAEEQRTRAEPAPRTRPAQTAGPNVPQAILVKKERARGIEDHVLRRRQPARPVPAQVPATVRQPVRAAVSRPLSRPLSPLRAKRARGQGAEALTAPKAKRTSLRDEMAAREKHAPAVVKAAPRGFLGSLLAAENIPRAIVISEILGPPKGLQ